MSHVCISGILKYVFKTRTWRMLQGDLDWKHILLRKMLCRIGIFHV